MTSRAAFATDARRRAQRARDRRDRPAVGVPRQRRLGQPELGRRSAPRPPGRARPASPPARRAAPAAPGARSAAAEPSSARHPARRLEPERRRQRPAGAASAPRSASTRCSLAQPRGRVGRARRGRPAAARSARATTSIAAVSRMSWLVAPRCASSTPAELRAAPWPAARPGCRSPARRRRASRCRTAPPQHDARRSRPRSVQPARARASAASASSIACSHARSPTAVGTPPAVAVKSVRHPRGPVPRSSRPASSPPRASAPRSPAASAAAWPRTRRRVQAVEHRGHPPGEVLHPPHAPQAAVGVARRAALVAVLEVAPAARGQHAHVGDRQVEALGAGGRARCAPRRRPGTAARGAAARPRTSASA